MEEAGKVFEALKRWEEIVSFDPDFERGGAFEKIAELKSDLGDVTGARAAYLEAIGKSPSNAIRQANFAGFCFETGSIPEAYQAYIRAIGLNEKESPFVPELVNQLLRAGQVLSKTRDDVHRDLFAVIADEASRTVLSGLLDEEVSDRT